ncbi:MAG: sulfatase-like hydrolase/transferase [Edaphobacter sp.]
MDFLKAPGDAPFFLQVSFPEPHGPSQLPRPYWNMFPPEDMVEPVPGSEVLSSMGYRMQWLKRLQEDGTPAMVGNWRRYLSNYYGAVRMVDDQIARLMGFLKDSERGRETLVVFSSDHGDYGMQYGLGRKGVGLSEALTHIPMIWRGPSVKRSGMDELHFISLADVMPTLCEAIGATIPEGVQGRSLWTLLRDEVVPAGAFRSVYTSAGVGGLYYDASDYIPVSIAEDKADHHRWDTLNMVTQGGNQKMLRMGKWKLIFDMMGYGQMYDLSVNPHEQNNVFGHLAVASTQNRLMEELAQWVIRTQKTLPASAGRRAQKQDSAATPIRDFEPGRN